jgi:hypothetical protein
VLVIHGQRIWKIKSECVPPSCIRVQLVQFAPQIFGLANASGSPFDNDFDGLGLTPVIAIGNPTGDAEPTYLVNVSDVVHIGVLGWLAYFAHQTQWLTSPAAAFNKDCLTSQYLIFANIPTVCSYSMNVCLLERKVLEPLRRGGNPESAGARCYPPPIFGIK